MSDSLIALQISESPWRFGNEPILVGKDILEVLTSAMYVDPLAVYREYVQNAADSIDEARAVGALDNSDEGTVEIDLDYEKRIARIRDNGIGVPSEEFFTRMTAFGSSAKRGTSARGFRGVGRLSGLAYCQELLFRSRFAGESAVSELRWDCREAKALLRSAEFSGDLDAIVRKCAQFRTINSGKWPKHFFEVELRSVSRLRNDWLLNSAVIEDYLSQVAPLPFAPGFQFSDRIEGILKGHVALGNLHLRIAENAEPIYRPHRDSFTITGLVDSFEEVEEIQIPGSDGGMAAVGWVLHHGYRGAMPHGSLKGLRLRSGDIQVGSSSILEELFTESRFNSWCVGEVHVVDPRIVPNGRRDHYEQNIHFTNLLNKLSPIARAVSSRCRKSSARRNWLRLTERLRDQIRRDLEIVKQGSLSELTQESVIERIAGAFTAIEKLIEKDALKSDAAEIAAGVARLRREFEKVSSMPHRAKVLVALSAPQRCAYEKAFALVYECSKDKAEAKLLVDRILARLSRSPK